MAAAGAPRDRLAIPPNPTVQPSTPPNPTVPRLTPPAHRTETPRSRDFYPGSQVLRQFAGPRRIVRNYKGSGARLRRERGGPRSEGRAR